VENPYIHCILHLVIHSICTHSGKSLHILHSSSIRSINLYSFHSPILIDQNKVLREPYLGVVTVVEEASIDGGGGDRQSRERRGLREFWDEKQNDTGWATIYRFKNISNGSYLKPLMIVLESGPKQFWFQTAADEGNISSGLKLEPLLIYGPALVQDEPLLIGCIL
jgi:hypothetical protein